MNNMHLFFTFLKKNKLLVLATSSLILLQSVATLFIPYLIAQLIDKGILEKNTNVVSSIGIQMLLTILVGALVGVLGSYYTSEIASRFGKETRKKLFRKIQDLSLNDTNKIGVASLVTRTSSDVVNIQEVTLSLFQMVLPSPFMAVISIVLAYRISPMMTVIPLISILIFIGVITAVMFKSTRLINNIQKKMDKMTMLVRQFFKGVKIIRAFDNAEYEKNKVDGSFNDFAANMIRINKYFAFLTPVAFSLNALTMIPIIWVGSSLVADNTIQVGSITAVIGYSVITMSSFIMTALIMFNIPRAIASLNRIQEVLTLQPEVEDDSQLNEKVDVTVQPALSFENVTFKYQGADKSVLEDMDFSINTGEVLAIVGGTGSGKSTIAKILLRFNDIQKGRILIHGTDISKLSQKDLRSLISYVPQRAFLFSGTIQDNILDGNKEATVNELRHAAQVAQALPFIEEQDQQFNALVAQGGTNFSGGQKQRLAIARALIKKSQIYVFDDSFSALDYKTDAKLRAALKPELKDAVTLIIAQRISTIIDADQIIVLNEGKIVGKGTHSELIEKNPVYQELAKSQNMLSKSEVKENV